VNALLIFLAVVVISAIIGGLAQVLKIVQKAEETRSARARSAARDRSDRSDRSERSGSGDIDRFLEEIDKLRRRGGVEPLVARPVAAPAPPPTRTRVIDRPPITSAPRALPSSRLDELPVAPVVVSPPTVARRAAPGRVTPPRTEFARGLTALLRSPSALPTAVVLQEVLGPPRCKRR
jgi:hypothetical protein